MKLSGRAEYFRELAHAVGTKATAVIMFAHMFQKLFPGLGARLRSVVRVLDVDCCSKPVSLRLGTSDKDVFRQVFIYEEYAPLQGIDDVRVIVDCGANIGLASMYLLDRYPSATLLAIEPDPENAAMCRRNLSRFGSRACVETAGIWSRGDWGCPARLRLDRNAGDGREWSIVVREATNGEDTETAGVGMDAICDRTGEIDLLKIDIEGAEEIIFSRDSASWLQRVRNMAIELHNEKCRKAFWRVLETAFEFESLHARETVFIKNLRFAGKAIPRCSDIETPSARSATRNAK
jgi:FkbM family methyltransferase